MTAQYALQFAPKEPEIRDRTRSRPTYRQRDPLACLWCSEWFEPQRPHARYCSDACRAAAHKAEPKERKRRAEEARRKMGMDTAARNNANQRAIARWIALWTLGRAERDDMFYAAIPGFVITSDLRIVAEAMDIELDWHKPWTGSLFQDGWFEWTGRWRAAEHEGSNARPVKEWRLSAAGHAALRSLKELGRNESPEP